ncbi:TcaA 3rd/4th domain-containing protein [Bacillus sp. NEB1478]|uniref:zinc ribbon domain-containing protein n=1 Tax=Bacillus sp. NEB1478 TaxID=3073816 RepID=UPI00287301B1|nr:zinc-ribbon domain-containing protein [Bacillus sp. NEB1478]WNB92520.1 zinc-ribbon domain-containing protein [Bacillus sp. NEB1478]
MDFCTNCGSPLQKDTQFCNECGTEITSTESNKMIQQTTKNEYKKAPLAKKKKRLLIAAGIGAAVLLGAYKTGDVLTDKDRLIDNFETALNEKDSEEIADLLTSNDKKLKIDDISVKGFVKYIDENPEEVENIISLLRKQSEYEEQKVAKTNDFFDEFAEDYLNDNVVTLEKNGKFLFYDNYELNINSVYLTVGTNYKNTTLYLNDKKVGKSNKPDYEKKIGPFLPGIYTLEAKLKTDFVDLVSKDKVSLINQGKEAYKSINLDGEDIYLESNIDSESGVKGKLFINGKDVGVNPFKNPTFGPVLTDGSMTLAVEAKFPWGTIKTDKMKIEDNNIMVDLTNNKEFKKMLMDTIVKHDKEWIVAYTSGDAKKISNTTNEYEEKISNEIQEAKDNDIYFKGKYLATTFDLDSFNVFHDGDSWKVNVDTKQDYYSDFYYEDDTPELEDDEEYWTYELTYNQNSKNWLINSTSQSYGFDSENVKTVKEKEPKEYVSAWASASASTEESTSISDDNVDALMSNYINGFVEAVNYGDYSYVSSYIKPGSSLDKAQQSVVKSLSEKGISEEVVTYNVDDWSQDGDILIIKTTEEISISEGGSTKTKKYNWTYTADLDNGELMLTNIK